MNIIADGAIPGVAPDLVQLCSFSTKHPDVMQRILTSSPPPDDLSALGQYILGEEALRMEFDKEKRRKAYIDAGFSVFSKCVAYVLLILSSLYVI